MVASFPLVASKDALYPRNLRLPKRRRISFTSKRRRISFTPRRRRISFTQGASVGIRAEDPEERTEVDDSFCHAKCAQELTSAEAHKQRKAEPPTLPSPGMAEDAAEVRNLRRVQAEGPPT
jgi:hypothetical protein